MLEIMIHHAGVTRRAQHIEKVEHQDTGGEYE
jgi:hypothetical protein